MPSRSTSTELLSARLERLRSIRPTPKTAAAVGELSASLLVSTRKSVGRSGKVIVALRAIIGDRALEHIAVVQVRGSTLTLDAKHPTLRFAMDRLLYSAGTLSPHLTAAGISRVRWRVS